MLVSVSIVSPSTFPIVQESFPRVATIGSETRPEISVPDCVRPNILNVYVPSGILLIYHVYAPGFTDEAIRSSV